MIDGSFDILLSSFSERWVRPDVGTFINFIDARAVNNPNSSTHGPDRQAGERIFAATQWVPTPPGRDLRLLRGRVQSRADHATSPPVPHRHARADPNARGDPDRLSPAAARASRPLGEPRSRNGSLRTLSPTRSCGARTGSGVHRHDFRAEGGGTRFDDTVVYAVPGGRLVDRLIVRPDLTRIFEYRRRVIGELLGTGVTGAASQSL